MYVVESLLHQQAKAKGTCLDTRRTHDPFTWTAGGSTGSRGEERSSVLPVKVWFQQGTADRRGVGFFSRRSIRVNRNQRRLQRNVSFWDS